MQHSHSPIQYKKSDKSDIESGLIPMINIVFLLLIFFMLSGQIQASLPAQVEVANTTSQAPLQQQAHTLLINTIEMDKSPFYLDGKAYAEADLWSALAELRENRQTEGKQPLAIYADRSLQAGELQRVLHKLADLQFEQIQLATQRGHD